MYIDSVNLRDVKCFKDIKLEFQTAIRTPGSAIQLERYPGE